MKSQVVKSTRFLWLLAIGISFWALPRSHAQSNWLYQVEGKAKYYATDVDDTGNGDYKVYVRWLPKDFATWERGNSVGYTIRRYTLGRVEMVNGKLTEELFPKDEVFASEVETTLTVASQDILEAENSDAMNVAAAAIYDPSNFQVYGFNNNPMIDAYERSKAKDTRMNFSLLAAQQSFHNAALLALGYIDTNTEVGFIYRYVISTRFEAPHEEEEVKKAVIKVNTLVIPKTDDETEKAAIHLSAQGMDKHIQLSWNKSLPAYMYFDIYRNGIKINKAPYLYSDLDNEEPAITYTDSVVNKIDYTYTVVGFDDFGFGTTTSNAIIASGKPAPMDTSPFIDSVYEATKGKMTIRWNFPSNLHNKISGFEVWRGADREKAFTRIAQNISKTTRIFTDNSALKSGYYAVIAKDLNGYDIRSIPKLAQLVDDIPPVKPIQVSGTVTEDGSVEIRWNPNVEADLMGYEVHISNHKYGEYVPATERYITDSKFYYYLNVYTLSEIVYVKVAALDQYYNRSDFSDIYELRLPDIVAPVNPVFLEAKRLTRTVNLYWIPSSSVDVAKQLVQRKKVKDVAWQTLGEINNKTTSVFQDSLGIPDLLYEYRIAALDEVNNTAYSQILEEVFPGWRPDVHNVNSWTDLRFRKIITTGGDWPKNDKCKSPNKIYWEYPLLKGLKEFRIYRRIGGGPQILLKTISVKDALFTDYVTIPNPNKKGGTLSFGMPNAKQNEGKIGTNQAFLICDPDFQTILSGEGGVEYQIVAVFANGSTSKPSISVSP